MNNEMDLKFFNFFNHNFHIFHSKKKCCLGFFVHMKKFCLENLNFQAALGLANFLKRQIYRN
jgi:hypothetical protein